MVRSEALILRLEPKTTRLIIWTGALLGCFFLVRFNIDGLAGVPATGVPAFFIFPGNDLGVYLRAGEALVAGESPYPNGYWTGPDVFHYSPVAAWFLKQLVGGTVPFRLFAYLHLGLIIVAFPLAWFSWRAVFIQLELKQGAEALVIWLPLWFVYSQWFADQNYLNIYTFLLLFTGLLALALLRQWTFPAIILAVLIAQTKPHYLYPLALPLLLGRWPFFLKVMLGCLIGYGLLAGAIILLAGPTYGQTLYRDYVIFLTTIAERYPWSDYYLGYNHSWQSILHWFFGRQAWVPAVVTGLRLVLFLPLIWLGYRWWQDRPWANVSPSGSVALGIVLAAHMWSMVSLDQLWEVTSAIIVFIYLFAVGSRPIRRLAIAIFVPFALLGLEQLAGWKVASIVAISADRLDISAQLPVIMATALGLYILTLRVVDGLLASNRSETEEIRGKLE